QFSDLQFVCNGQHFNVHKAFICLQSPPIKAAVEGNFQESQSATINMDSFRPSTVKALVQYLYTGGY
ncbi:hypothetical protein BP00DRAFT_301075, partial [Aspergillus indologenus CBS 114.80]